MHDIDSEPNSERNEILVTELQLAILIFLYIYGRLEAINFHELPRQIFQLYGTKFCYNHREQRIIHKICVQSHHEVHMTGTHHVA